MNKFYAPSLALLITAHCAAQSFSGFCDSIASAAVREKSIPGVVITIVSGSEVRHQAYGFADIDRKTSVDSTTLFQLGSVGKVLTAIAVLQQAERGKLDLHADVNTYLTAFKIPDTYPTPVTLFHLLTHTAGFNDRVIGYGARTQADVQPLGEHLAKFLPGRQMDAGKEINYSNYSYALAGYIVEVVSGEPFTEYVKGHIFDPLNMQHSSYTIPTGNDNAAIGYSQRDTTFNSAPVFARHALPAGSLVSNQADMSKVIHELMYPTGKLLRDESRQLLFSRQFGQHELLLGYSLGLEEQNIAGHRGFAKGGNVPSFMSAVAFFPSIDVGLFIAANTSNDEFAEKFVQAFFNRFFTQPTSAPAQSITVNVDEFTGTFTSNRTNKETIEELVWLYRGEFNTWKDAEGDLACRHNGAVQKYKPVAPLVFQNINNTTECLVFAKDESGNIRSLYRNVNIGGLYVPQSLTRVAWYDDPVFINESYAFVLLIVLLFILIVPVRIFIWIRRRTKQHYFKGRLLPASAVWLGLITGVLFAYHFVNGVLYLFRHADDLYFGVAPALRNVQYLTYSFPILVACMLVVAVYTWVGKRRSLFARLYFTLVALASLIHLIFLFRWNFIGLNF